MNTGCLDNFFKDNSEQLLKLDYYAAYSVAAPKSYCRCPHCGTLVKSKGIGSHQQGGECLSRRHWAQAILLGYIRAPVEWSKHTAAFQRRFWTDWEGGIGGGKGRPSKGRLRQQAWVDARFAKVWERTHYVHDPMAIPVATVWPTSPATPGGMWTSVNFTLSPQLPAKKKGITQIPRPEYAQLLADLVKYKKRNNLKQVELIYGMLEMVMEEHANR